MALPCPVDSRLRGNDREGCWNDGKSCVNDRVQARKNDGRFCNSLQQAKFIDGQVLEPVSKRRTSSNIRIIWQKVRQL